MRDLDASKAELLKIWGSKPYLHKFPDDLLRYERIIEAVKPAVIVETGLLFGESQRWFAARVPHVISVDSDGDTIQGYYSDRWGLGAPPVNGHVVHGDSRREFGRVREMAEMYAAGGPVLVVLDSDHGTETVYGEMVWYSQLVTAGSYLVVEDGIIGYMPVGTYPTGNWYDGSPLIALARWLPDHPEFAVDVEIEDMLPTTCAPGGWLKRIA